METIQEKEKKKVKEKPKTLCDNEIEELAQRLSLTPGFQIPSSSTESIGNRNVKHRRVQSTATVFSILDTPSLMNMRHRARSLSLAEYPSLDKYYPGSHLVDNGGLEDSACLYLSLWLLPPDPLCRQLSKDNAKTAMRHSKHGSSAPFAPHITIVGSIRCETHRDATDLGKKLSKGLKGSGTVPCRFPSKEACVAMHNPETSEIVWSQSCIAIMERSEEYMNLLSLSRKVLGLPPGEWMFPGPASEPHFSCFYGKQFPTDTTIPPPPDFVADEAALFVTTPGTLQGVARWREVGPRIHLR